MIIGILLQTYVALYLTLLVKATGTLQSAPAVIILIKLVSNALIKQRTGMRKRKYAVPLKMLIASLAWLQTNGMLF